MYKTFILAGVITTGLLACTDKAPPAVEQTAVVESPLPQNETRYVTDQYGVEYFDRDGFSSASELKGLVPVGTEITVVVDENGQKVTHPKLPGFVGAQTGDRGSVWIREDRLAGSPPAPGTRGQAIVGDHMFTYPLERYRVSISRTAAGGLSLGFSSNGGEAEISAVDAANRNVYGRNLVNPDREFLVDYPPALQERRKAGHNKDIEVIIRRLAERNEGVSETGQRPDVLISSLEGDIVFSFYHVGRQDRAVPLFEEIALNWERLPVSRFFQAVADNDTGIVGKMLHAEDDATALKKEMTRRLMWLRRDGRTALYMAAEKGFTDMARLLIDAGAPLERGFEYHVSEDPPLSAALAAGREETARLLIDKGASRDGICRGGRTILTRAIRNDKTEMIRLGLSLGLNPDTPDAEGDLPLIRAVAYKRPDMVRLLVEAGADVNRRDREDRSALDMAVVNGQKEIIEYLKGRGAR